MPALDMGDRAPDFSLPSSTGTPVTLSEVLRQYPAVLVFYLFDFGAV